jgi:hypothetical protein
VKSVARTTRGKSTIAAAAAAVAVATGTAAETTAAAAAAAGTAAEAAAITAGFHRTGFIHNERTAIEVRAVELVDSGLGLFVRSHFHETEALGAAGVAVDDDAKALDLADLAEHFAHAIFGDVERKVADVKLLTHDAKTSNSEKKITNTEMNQERGRANTLEAEYLRKRT